MILLDTHTWVWWVSNPEGLSARARRAIDESMTSTRLYVSSISVWEVALLVARGRLLLTLEVDDWIARSEALPQLGFVPVDNHIARKAVGLAPPLHNDPADRIIIATALVLGASIVSKDRKIRGYPHVTTIW